METTQMKRSLLERLIFGGMETRRRHTQDSPVLPDVWLRYAEAPGEDQDVLLEPWRKKSPAKVKSALENSLDPRRAQLAYNETHAVARISFEQLVRVVLPVSGWWSSHVFPKRRGASLERLLKLPPRKLAALLRDQASDARPPVLTADARWLLNLIGVLHWSRRADGPLDEIPDPAVYVDALRELLAPIASEQADDALIWAVTLNRRGTTAIWQSVNTVKGDAARSLFTVSCDGIVWAILDTGIDATHPAFRRRERGKLSKLDRKQSWRDSTRVLETYDFTRVRELFNPHSAQAEEMTKKDPRIATFRQQLLDGRPLDWSWLIDANDTFKIPHDKRYVVPKHPHGTHVAGILAGDWRRGEPGYSDSDDYDLVGLCPDLELLDLRVLGDDGTGNEFAIIAALQFLQYYSRTKAKIHGANLSLSIPHDVSNYACGRTPVCEEATRLVSSGVVTVAAAGNLGYVQYLTQHGPTDAYRNISVTDPGNADAVIAVGSVHRSRPHTYGVSYFSSRGPTGDGRIKPDLVAPGEKVKSAAPGERALSMDGTSQATPHVSGAAALLMARHRELIGEPALIKNILTKTATDLGRERYFQGGGLVDILRALQSV